VRWLIIAEVGQNFCGNLDLAKKLIKLAKECGADLAKFQLYGTESLYSSDSPFKQQAKESELSFEQAKMLFDYGKEIGIEVFFSVFDVERVKWCEAVGVKRYKVAYKMRDTQILQEIVNTGKPVIMSVKHPRNHRIVTKISPQTILIFCIPKYPTPIQDLHFDDVYFEPDWMEGFSDHTIGLDASKIALARGAKIIEKHFSLCYNIGVDGAWSMTPEDLRELKRWEQVVKQVL